MTTQCAAVDSHLLLLAYGSDAGAAVIPRFESAAGAAVSEVHPPALTALALRALHRADQRTC